MADVLGLVFGADGGGGIACAKDPAIGQAGKTGFDGETADGTAIELLAIGTDLVGFAGDLVNVQKVWPVIAFPQMSHFNC